MADLSGDLGVSGTATDSLLLIYPNPTSPTCDCGTADFSEKGMMRGSMGECTAVASAKRGVLGGLSDDDVDDEDVESVDGLRTGARFKASVRFFSCVIAIFYKANRRNIWKAI